ncbi:glycosyltransferase [Lutispora sp.]|uniref:glycosyltransferase n=1 Tax=Lutispora sp. TaxID=2828727 RepID=UPI002B1EE1D7|nr:glycosyltransferase [Lutispora sp.]MEA4962848.1 glycosyltransferase [Lutispora sp.]
MKISLCMIVKNEEKNILNCLDRALEVADEAIIVDTGSTDKTKELLGEKYARDSRVKIIEYIWEDDFSKARNKFLEYADGDWILVLDADERLFCDRKRLEGFLNSREDKAYIIPIYNIMDRDNITISSTMTRLYRNDNPSYKGAIHEQILIDGKILVPDIVDGDICKIYHYGYTGAVFKGKGKQERNMDIIKAQIEEEPNIPFHWYNKGVMEMCQENYDTAIDDFIKSHTLTNKTRMAFHDDLVIRLIQCMVIEKQNKMAIQFIKTVANDPYIGKIPDIYYYCGIAYANIKKYPLAIKNFKKAIETGEYEKGTSKYGAGSFLPKLEWAKVLLFQEMKEAAIEKYKEAVFDKNNVNKQGLNELKYLLQEENRIDELNQLEEALSDNKKKDDSLKISLLDNPDFDKYKSGVKENIKTLVESGLLKEAKEAVEEYEKIVKDDIDIYSIKGVIAMMEGDMIKAEVVFKAGLNKEPFNGDLLYNIAYLYETQKKYIDSYEFYKRVSKVADEGMKIEISSKIEELEKMDEIIKYKSEKSDDGKNLLVFKKSMSSNAFNHK